MTWDLWLLLILVVLAAAGLIVPVLIVWGSRIRYWYSYRHLRQAYLPLDRSCPPWRSNVRVSR
mgnify:CR=1 FL=1